MWAVVGLGNPGKAYVQTRHNAGFLFVRRVAKERDVRLKKRAFSSKVATIRWHKEKVLLALPQTYMNGSGLAVKRILRSGGVLPGRLVVVYDDLDIPLGDIRVRKKGSAGTHLGMGSVVRETETTLFPRIRIGIGPLVEDCEAMDFVLSRFDREELPLLEQGFSKAEQALDSILRGDIEKAMNEFNTKAVFGSEDSERPDRGK